MTVIVRLTDVTNHDVGIRLRNPWPGWWLASYDADACNGLGDATFTNDPAAALTFASIDAVRDFWGQTSSVLPVRDGQPNRPLTVCSVETVDYPPTGSDDPV